MKIPDEELDMLSYKDNNLKIHAVNILKINNFGIINDYICYIESGGK